MADGKDQDTYSRGLERSRRTLWGRIADLFGPRPTLEQADLDELEDILIAGDVGAASAGIILGELKSHVGRGHEATPEAVRGFLTGWISRALSPERGGEGDFQEDFPAGRLRVVLMVGVNGSGKTTTAGKLAGRLKSEGRKVMLVGADTFRAAAADQLGVWAQRTGSVFVRGADGSDPAAVVHDALSSARSSGLDVVLVDTAGRLHTKEPLMKELEKIGRVAARMVEGAPHKVLLVLDATTGQNALVQARTFTRSVPVNGLVVTKMDGTAKGGVLIPIVRELRIPVEWVGMGEGVEDLVPFDPEAYARNLVGG